MTVPWSPAGTLEAWLCDRRGSGTASAPAASEPELIRLAVRAVMDPDEDRVLLLLCSEILYVATGKAFFGANIELGLLRKLLGADGSGGASKLPLLPDRLYARTAVGLYQVLAFRSLEGRRGILRRLPRYVVRVHKGIAINLGESGGVESYDRWSRRLEIRVSEGLEPVPVSSDNFLEWRLLFGMPRQLAPKLHDAGAYLAEAAAC